MDPVGSPQPLEPLYQPASPQQLNFRGEARILLNVHTSSQSTTQPEDMDHIISTQAAPRKRQKVAHRIRDPVAVGAANTQSTRTTQTSESIGLAVPMTQIANQTDLIMLSSSSSTPSVITISDYDLLETIQANNSRITTRKRKARH